MPPHSYKFMKYSIYAPSFNVNINVLKTSNVDSPMKSLGDHDDRKIDEVTSNILILSMKFACLLISSDDNSI